MNSKGLKPALLLHGPLYWLAWDATGKCVFAFPSHAHYLMIQGMLENHGFYDIEENSAQANQIRDKVEARQNSW